MRPDTTGKQLRAATFKREAINVDARTVELAFASETPYERYWGVEILDCTSASVDLSRLNDAAPLLDCHDPEEQIGVIDRAWVGPDKICRASVRFSRSKDAEEVFQDVVDGIRQKVSVGYTIDELRLEGTADGVDTYRITKWTPLEVSIVSIPADSTVGVGRSAAPHPSQEKSTMPEANAPVATPAAAAPAPTITVDDTATRRLAEVREILAAGEQYADRGGREFAARAVQEGRDIRWFCDQLLARVASSASQAGAGAIGMSTTEQKRFSLGKLIRALMFGDDRNLRAAAAFEFEAADAAARAVGGPKVGNIVIPMDAFAGYARDMSASGSSGSNYLVATNNVPGGLIELLRNRMVVADLGARRLDGLVGNVTIPRLSAASTAYWLSTEATAITESQPTLGQLALSPKHIGGLVDVTRILTLQATPDVEALVMEDLLNIIAIGIDKAALNGAGSGGEPTGVSATSGIGSVTGTSLAYAGVMDFQNDVASGNVRGGTLAYVTTPAVASLMIQRQRFSSTDSPLWVGNIDDGTMAGRRAVSTNQIASASMIYGDWSQVLLASWGSVELKVSDSDSTKFQAGISTVRALAAVDVGVRIASAFSQATSIT